MSSESNTSMIIAPEKLFSFFQNKPHCKTKYNWYISWLIKNLDTLGPLGLKFPSSLTLIRFAFTFSAEKMWG